jgi:hypothetical protein
MDRKRWIVNDGSAAQTRPRPRPVVVLVPRPDATRNEDSDEDSDRDRPEPPGPVLSSVAIDRQNRRAQDTLGLRGKSVGAHCHAATGRVRGLLSPRASVAAPCSAASGSVSCRTSQVAAKTPAATNPAIWKAVAVFCASRGPWHAATGAPARSTPRPPLSRQVPSLVLRNVLTSCSRTTLPAIPPNQTIPSGSNRPVGAC